MKLPSTKPPGQGWIDWMDPRGPRPEQYVEVELWRKGWSTMLLEDAADIDPATNVYGLYWRPAGPMKKVSNS